MKSILYGIGKRFEDLAGTPFYIDGLARHGYEVVGVCDKAKAGENVTFGERLFVVGGPDVCLRDGCARIVVTSAKYFAEIAGELVTLGVERERIIRLRDIEMELEDDVYGFEQFAGKDGIEIGGPSRVFEEIYRCCRGCDDVNFSADTVWWKKSGNVYKAGKRELGHVFIADAVDLSGIGDASYDFVLSSNNLEHIANPLKAVSEFVRILRPHGLLVLVVPFKEKTFDHRRPFTSFAHLLDDYEKGVGEDDLSHLAEIVELHDYAMDAPCGGREKFILRAQRNYENRCLHQHVFGEVSLRAMFAYFSLDVLSFACIGQDIVARLSRPKSLNF